MITIDQVKRWIPSGRKNRGDCILAGTSSGWVESLCGWIGPGTDYKGPPPAKICGKCKAAMKTARVHTPNNDSTSAGTAIGKAKS